MYHANSVLIQTGLREEVSEIIKGHSDDHLLIGILTVDGRTKDGAKVPSLARSSSSSSSSSPATGHLSPCAEGWGAVAHGYVMTDAIIKLDKLRLNA